jgi:hypothetical protein
MVGVAQWLEHWIVVPVVGGSSPLPHPLLTGKIATEEEILRRILFNTKTIKQDYMDRIFKCNVGM